MLVPFFFFLSRYHISIQPTSTTTTAALLHRHYPRSPSPPPPPSPPSLRFRPYFHSIPSSPRFESGMRSPVRKKGALKRFLLAMGTPSPTPYRVYRVPHITNAGFPLIVRPSSPFAPVHESFVFLVLFLPRRFSRFFVLLRTPPASRARPLPRMPDRIYRKGQPPTS